MPKLHPLNFLIIPAIGIISSFLANSVTHYSVILLGACTPVLVSNYSKINFKLLLWISLWLIFTVGGYVVTSMLYNAHTIEYNLLRGYRLFNLSFISFIYATSMPYDALTNELMQRKLMSVKASFALLAVFNAFAYLVKQFNQMKINYQMRLGKKLYVWHIILPLLVSASRYANNISISLHCRGINNQRTFYTKKQRYTCLDALLSITIALNILICS